ncbi:SRPBCC domain-containing protein [Oleiharenicola lentus]|uniref:SRPBCC domain-containing protein n=1 Tax=Oleiharenicola lentus TaxID=2508720 RepID=UPI003F6705DB
MSAPDQSFSILSTREFPVSRERLFRAFSDPQQLPHWWGPKGFTNTFEKFDLRAGGEWLFTMHGPNGANYPNRKEFTEVIVPERVVFKHFQPTHRFTMTLIFDEISATRSRLTWHMDFVDREQPPNLRSFITHANEENFDRLENYLKTHP